MDVVPGATLKILIMAKGGGCENRSKYKMLTPAEGIEGVKDWILECIKTAGPDACPPLDALEREVLERANRLGIGPQGYGGDTTALGIHVLTYPCHITSLPVAVTIECHAHRHKEATL